jgi:cytochrome P450
VRKGAFLVHSLGDVHFNADIYSDPWKFDPDRYTEGREEDKKGTLSYLAWGAGRCFLSPRFV